MNGSYDISWVWAIGLISFACGIAFGLGISFLVRGNKKRIDELENVLKDERQEFDNYRKQVSEHFLTTSELVNKMTDSYRNVYEHLASSSQALCQTPVDGPSLDFTHKPVLDTATKTPQEDTPQPPDEPVGEKIPDEDNDSDTCIGDAPHVPSLTTETESNPRTPST